VNGKGSGLVEQLIRLLKERGPLTGKDLVRETGMDVFSVWKACRSCDQILNRLVGRRYLRLDKKVEDYARLSPSIMREFLNYTIVGLEKQKPAMESMAQSLQREIAAISSKKMQLAGETVARVKEEHPDGEMIMERAAFIIAGDVVFNMAHSEPRPEFSTGELVRGSDLDLIIVVDNLPVALVKDLDRVVYREKFNLLINPASKEELDYIIKDIDTVREQLRFDNFKAMVASKILHEGLFLGGSRSIFDQIKNLLKEFGIEDKIALFEKKARRDRVVAEKLLASAKNTDQDQELMSLFYTTEEKEEII